MTSKKHSIPYSIWALGAASLLLNSSSVIVFSLSPLFAKNVLGISVAIVGILEGSIEFLSFFTRIFSGTLSDFLKKRKGIIAFGYGLCFLSRPLLAMATTIGSVLIARCFDRVGNGLIAPPRDALIGDLSPPEIKGASYGLRESLSRAGAFLGSLVAMYLLWVTALNYALVFWIAAVPTALALLTLVMFVKDPTKSSQKAPETVVPYTKKERIQKICTEILHLPSAFWLIVFLSGVFMFSSFSGAFLFYRAEQMGVSAHLSPLVMVIQNIGTVASAYPIGYLSDRIGRRSLLGLGILCVIASNILLSLDGSIALFFFGILLWGVEIGITISILSVLLADACPGRLRGTGFGLFHFVNGICLFLTNWLAGWIWENLGSAFLFYESAAFAALSGVVLLFVKPSRPSHS